MFTKDAMKREWREPVAGVRQVTTVHGEKTLMTEFRLEPGALIPPHAHPYEQTGYLVSGRMRMRIGAEWFEARDGDSWCIPGGVEHEVRVDEACRVVEVFAPVRKDYLPAAG